MTYPQRLSLLYEQPRVNSSDTSEYESVNEKSDTLALKICANYPNFRQFSGLYYERYVSDGRRWILLWYATNGWHLMESVLPTELPSIFYGGFWGGMQMGLTVRILKFGQFCDSLNFRFFWSDLIFKILDFQKFDTRLFVKFPIFSDFFRTLQFSKFWIKKKIDCDIFQKFNSRQSPIHLKSKSIQFSKRPLCISHIFRFFLSDWIWKILNIQKISFPPRFDSSSISWSSFMHLS